MLLFSTSCIATLSLCPQVDTVLSGLEPRCLKAGPPHPRKVLQLPIEELKFCATLIINIQLSAIYVTARKNHTSCKLLQGKFVHSVFNLLRNHIYMELFPEALIL